jgi:hypothetical protein
MIEMADLDIDAGQTPKGVPGVEISIGSAAIPFGNSAPNKAMQLSAGDRYP